MKLFSFLTTLLLFTFGSAQQISDTGWTVLDPSKADKIIYVSDSEGNDQTGVIYTPSNSDVFSNPFDSSAAIQPFKTIQQAANQISDNGEAAWILLKRGDTFYSSLPVKNGLSEDKPFMYSSYGVSNQPPLLKTGDSDAIRFCCNDDISDFRAVGISFYAYLRNPDDSGYQGPIRSRGIYLVSTSGATIKNILIEGCTFDFYSNNEINDHDGRVKNITLRRNLITNNYSVDGHSQGLYAGGVDGIELIENIFDHNGWYKQSINSNNSKEDGQATIFNHNSYFATLHNVLFEGNSFYRPSSIGTKWTANEGPASTTNVKIINNFYHDCEIGISIGGNEETPPHRFKNIQIQGNVISDLGKSQQTNRTLGWGIEIKDWDNGICMDNYILTTSNPEVTSVRAIIMSQENRDVTISHNIMHDMNGKSIGIGNMEVSNIIIEKNKISLPARNQDVFISVETPYTIFSENQYYHPSENYNDRFKIGSSRVDVQEWSDRLMENNMNFGSFDFPDDSRNMEKYITEVLGLSGYDEFYSEIGKMNHLNWRLEYTAEAITKWIKEGFDSNSLNIPDQNKKTITLYPNPTKENIFVTLDNSNIKRVTIYSLLGKQIQTVELMNQNENEIPTEKLTAGIYIMKFFDDSRNKTYFERFVKK